MRRGSCANWGCECGEREAGQHSSTCILGELNLPVLFLEMATKIDTTKATTNINLLHNHLASQMRLRVVFSPSDQMDTCFNFPIEFLLAEQSAFSVPTGRAC